MKVKPEHYEHMKEMMKPWAVHADSQREYIRIQGKAKDIEKRLRWDLFYAAKLTGFACDILYPYGVYDIHIDTALKSIMKDLDVTK